MLDLIPTPDKLQVGWDWFQILLTVTWVMNALVPAPWRRAASGQSPGQTL